MENQCKYRLHPRYENIPLEFGSPILVNNSNITNEYAEKLLQHKNGERYFSTMPQKQTALIPETGKPHQTKKSKQSKKKAPVKPDTIPDNNVK